MSRLCELYHGFCLTTEEKARKNLSQICYQRTNNCRVFRKLKISVQVYSSVLSSCVGALSEETFFFLRSSSSKTGHASSIVSNNTLKKVLFFSSMSSFNVSSTQFVLLLYFLYISLHHHRDSISAISSLPSLTAYDFIQMQTTCAQFKRCIYLASNCFCSYIFVLVLLPVAGSLITSF